MNTNMAKTYMAKPSDIERRWFHIDAEGKVLGRLAVEVARILMGKHRPTYTPHIDTGDFVVVTNADKVVITGKKAEQKKYYHYTGYPGGLVETSYKRMRARKPEQVVRLAIRRMLPKTKLGRAMISKLKIHTGPEHPHTAQQPETLELKIAHVSPDVRKGRT
jgi:large subunit ribosomal protein L13